MGVEITDGLGNYYDMEGNIIHCSKRFLQKFIEGTNNMAKNPISGVKADESMSKYEMAKSNLSGCLLELSSVISELARRVEPVSNLSPTKDVSGENKNSDNVNSDIVDFLQQEADEATRITNYLRGIIDRLEI